MQNPSKFPYKCCTHYNKQGYDEGYLMLPIFRVRVFRNCGECQAVWGWAANILLCWCSVGSGMEKFTLTAKNLDKSEICGYSEKSSKRAWEAAASLHPFQPVSNLNTEGQ